MAKSGLKKGYTLISNHALKNQELSLKAKGLYCLIASLPPTWDFSINGIVSLVPDGKDAVTKELKVLEKAGYIKRIQHRNQGKFNSCTYEVVFEPLADLPLTDLPLTDLPLTEIPPQLNTKQLNTKQLKEKNIKKEKDSFFSIFYSSSSSPLKEAIDDFIQMRIQKKSPLTDKALDMIIKKLTDLSKDETEQIAILNQSTMNGWNSLRPLDKPKVEFKPLMEEPIDNNDEEFDEVAYTQMMNKLKRREQE